MSARRSVRTRAWLALVCAACGSPAPREPAPVASPVAGRAAYELRQVTRRGLSRELTTRPVRFASVELVGADGGVLARTTTDARGRFRFDRRGDATRVRLLARAPAADVEVTADPFGREPHASSAPVGEGAVLLRATVASGAGGAFHVLDTLVRGVETAERWSGRSLPPVFAWWQRGGPQQGTVYLEERPEGSGRFGVSILGGTEGAYETSDADEHDEGLVLHELGHLVMERLTFDSSLGGAHPRGARLDPGLAWEEGRATFFALAVLGSPVYRDTLGIEPHGSLAIDEDAEAIVDPLPGPGSEVGVIAILWDLADGDIEEGAALPDRDDDGVALGPAAVLRAMIDHADEPGAYPSLESFLEHLVAEGLVGAGRMTRLLARHGRDRLETAWPRPLALGDSVTGRIDGLSEPAPSGGISVSATGFDANDTYRLRVERRGRLELALTIDGTGLAADRSDLDLELRDQRSRLLAGSWAEDPRETVSQPVKPGWYLIRVHDGGSGNRADYRLVATLR